MNKLIYTNQYIFPDETIIDFANREPQEVLDAHKANKDRSDNEK